ncbi:MAG: MATE family efflux transporter [Eubacteriales bacterium]|nr:MATE family efflux transporter [Eubacteriales bacterium]
MEKKAIFKTIILLAIPTMLEQILSTLLQYVDTAMVGNLGEQATASVSVTTTINWLIGSIASAIGVAGIAMISKAVGKDDREEIRCVSSQLFLLILACAAVLGGASMILSPYIPIWMGAEQSIQKDASAYFFIISVPMLFRVANTICGAALRATKNTKTPMVINMITNIMNIALNYMFIYIMHMGVVGAAWGSAISYVVSGALMFWAYRKNEMLCWEWKKLSIHKEQLKECVRIGVPVLLTSATSCFGYIVFAALVSGMGTTIFAAHSIAVTAETIFYIPGYGLRTATSTMVGIALGEQNKRKFDLVSEVSIVITMVMMILNGVLLYIVALPLMELLTSSQPVAVLGAEMLKLVAFTEPFFGLMIVMEGILYGLGRTKYAFVVETFSMWGIRIMLTALCVLIWKLDLRAVWYCMIADNICKALLLAIPMCLKKYRKKLFMEKCL